MRTNLSILNWFGFLSFCRKFFSLQILSLIIYFVIFIKTTGTSVMFKACLSNLTVWKSTFLCALNASNSFFCRLITYHGISSFFLRHLSRQVLRAIFSFSIILYDSLTFFTYNITIWPITSFEFWEYKQPFIRNFKSSSSWYLLIVRNIFIAILNQIVVNIIM